MADSRDADSGADARSTRRDRRVVRRQDHRRRVVTLAAAIVIAIGFGLLATETVRFGGDDRPTLAGAVRAEPDATSSTTTTLPGRACRADLTVDDPLRLWVGGDSLAGSLGPALGTIAGATGVVQPYFDSRVSSGLTNPGFFDWPEHAQEEMQRLNPEIAVFIIGANDYLAPRNGAPAGVSGSTTSTVAIAGEDPDATTAVPDEPWRTDYENRVEAMLRMLEAPGRTVIWVGPPPFKNERDDEDVKQISEASKEVVARHKDAVFVDDYALFLDQDGKYADKLPDENGNLTLVRSGDGIHLTLDGGNRLARAVYALVDAQCKTSSKAVPGVVKATIQSPGSTQVAPGSTNRSGATVSTLPPATAQPATTQPPATTAPATTAPPATSEPPSTTATTSAPPSTTAP
ncbi:MAG TPA: DUF459 domain-containing protein [Acidimicrobiia bacterium]|jgi:hypothetical protein